MKRLPAVLIVLGVSGLCLAMPAKEDYIKEDAQLQRETTQLQQMIQERINKRIKIEGILNYLNELEKELEVKDEPKAEIQQ